MRTLGFKCVHCGRRSLIRKVDQSSLEMGELKVVVCDSCGSIDEVACLFQRNIHPGTPGKIKKKQEKKALPV